MSGFLWNYFFPVRKTEMDCILCLISEYASRGNLSGVVSTAIIQFKKKDIKKKILSTYKSYIVKENHIGSVVCEILRYTKTDTDSVTYI